MRPIMAANTLDELLVSIDEPLVKPKVPENFKRYYVIRSTINPSTYLRGDVYVAMKKYEKWRPFDWAAKFLTIQAAQRFAERMAGNGFKIVEADLPTTRPLTNK